MADITKSLQNSVKVLAEVRKSVIGKDEVLGKILMAVLAKGHILIDDIPGVGKTTIAVSFAAAMGLKENRIQFTPDVLPSDLTGFSIINRETNKFEYREGAVMCNVLLGDEINRTSPKTQSALLQVMEEGRVSVDGVTRDVPKPFIVIATQNPIGSIGTQRLPESQIDRFMIKITIGYPQIDDEISILKGREEKLIRVSQAVSHEELLEMQNSVADIYVNDDIFEYIARISKNTRSNPEIIQLGVSPRGSLALLAMTKAHAFLAGRNYAIPSDVQKVIHDTVDHRIILSEKAKMNHMTETDIIDTIIKSVPVPKI